MTGHPARLSPGQQVAKVLAASVRAAYDPADGDALGAQIAACDPSPLVDLAIAEGVAGPARRALEQHLPAEHLTRLRREADLDAIRHLTLLGLLNKVGTALEEAGIPWVVLKGPALAELGQGAVTRRYTDLDVLVPAARLRDAARALGTVEVVPADQDWAGMARRVKGEMTLSVGGMPLVDLHWHPVYLRSARERWHIATDELLERRQPVQLRNVRAWTLDPEDFTAHVALHASFSSIHQLRRLIDVDRTVAERAPDWDLLVGRCQRWRVGLAVGVMLSRARSTLGTAVPEGVIRDLAGGRSGRLVVHRLSEWSPPGGSGSRSLRNGLTRCLRDNPWSTACQFARESGTLIGGRLAGRVGLRRAGGPAEAASGPGDYEHFLETIELTDFYGHLPSGRGAGGARGPQ